VFHSHSLKVKIIESMKYEQFSDFILIKMKPNEMTDKLEQKQVKDLP